MQFITHLTSTNGLGTANDGAEGTEAGGNYTERNISISLDNHDVGMQQLPTRRADWLTKTIRKQPKTTEKKGDGGRERKRRQQEEISYARGGASRCATPRH